MTIKIPCDNEECEIDDICGECADLLAASAEEDEQEFEDVFIERRIVTNVFNNMIAHLKGKVGKEDPVVAVVENYYALLERS